MTGPSKWSRPAREARRLNAEERAFRLVAERDFQRQVTDLAVLLGWTWCHWRPLRNGRGTWQVPVEGPLGRGWPDLTLLRVRDRRLVFAELKREDQDPTADQVAVLEQLGVTCEVYVWRPSDLADPVEDSVIWRALR